MKKYLDPKFFLPLLLIIFPFVVYWITKPPSILWIDSGTMIGASYTLGIPNPPGFPFYMMASHIFSILPIFNVLTRLELFSIVFAVAGLFFLYKVILLIIDNDFFFHKPANNLPNLYLAKKNFKYYAAFFGALSLAFSYQFWSQSQNTEAFIFTDFFLILFIYLLLYVEKKRKEFLYVDEKKANIKKFASYFFKIFLLLAFLYGLAAGANPTIAVLVPGVLYVMYLNRRILSLQKIIILGLVFAITLTAVYSYLPIRASSWPFVNWGNPQTVDLLIGHLRGEGLNIFEPQSGSINGFTGSPVVFFQSVSHFFYLLFLQFTPFLLPFLFFGAYYIFKKNNKLFLLLISVPLIDVIYSGIYLSGNQESWFILAWIICAIFIGVGLYFVFIRFALRQNQRRLLLFLSILPFLFWLIPLDRSGHYYTDDYARNLYTSLKSNAILIEVGDFTNSLGYYLHEADKLRPDVTPVTANVFYVNKWYRDGLRHASSINVSSKMEEIIQYKAFDEYNRAMNQFIADNIDKYPIYATHLSLRASALAATDGGQLRLDDRFKFIPHGLSLEIVRASKSAQPNLNAFKYSFKTANFPKKAPFYLERNYRAGYKNILNDYAYGFEALGDWYFSQGNAQDAYKYYKKADEWSPNNAEIISRFGQYYAFIKQYDISRQFFEKALKLLPDSLLTRFNLANTLADLGRYEEALEQYKLIQQLVPGEEIALQSQQEEQKILNNNSIIPQPTKTNDLNLGTYTNALQNYTFNYPQNWILNKEQAGVVLLTNGKKDLSIINVYVFGQKMPKNETIENIIKVSPIKTPGTFLGQQSLSLEGFNGIVQIWGNQQLTLQVYALQKGDWLYIIRLDLASANSINDFNILLKSFKSLHE